MERTADVSKAVSHYESYINDTMKENLRAIDLRLQKVNGEIAEFTQIKKCLEVLKGKVFEGELKTQVDVGCNFFIEARVQDPSRLLFNIGLDHYLEFTPEEACRYADARIEALEVISKHLLEKSAETKAYIKLMLFGIGELQNIKPTDES